MCEMLWKQRAAHSFKNRSNGCIEGGRHHSIEPLWPYARRHAADDREVSFQPKPGASLYNNYTLATAPGGGTN
jgi:hypothetical protein